MQVVILGAHRSGTSALTRLINMMGVYVGGEGSTIGFNPENPKGFWERRDVINLNDAILEHYDCTWDDLDRWPSADLSALPIALNDRIKHIVLEMDHHRPWVLKEPRLCQTFPLWQPHLEVPLVIIAWREPMEVALSLHHRNGVPLLHGLAIWEHCMIHALKAAQSIPHIVLSHHDTMQNPVAVTQRVYEWLNQRGVQAIRMPPDIEITRFIDPKLYRARANDKDTAALLSPEIMSLRDYLSNPTANLPDVKLSTLSQQAFALYHQTRAVSNEKNSIQSFSERQAERIRELEAMVARYEELTSWYLEESQWLGLLDRFNAMDRRIDAVNGEIEAIKHSSLLGLIRRTASSLLQRTPKVSS